MAQTVTQADLIADIRVMSGLRNNQLFSDDQIISLIGDAADELYDIVEGSFQFYNVLQYPFTIAPGQSSVPLPLDFKRDDSLTVNPASCPSTVPPLGSWLERNQVTTNLWGTTQLKYFLVGSTLQIFPPAQAPADYILYYTPQFAFAPPIPSITATLATTAALPSYTITGGPGPGRVFTQVGTGQLVVDGTNGATGDIILVKDESNLSNNGLFTLTQPIPATTPWHLTRTTTYDSNAEIISGTTIGVSTGTTNVSAVFTLTTSPVDVDVLPLTYEAAPLLLPQYMAPWAVYLKTHVSVAIRMSRKQPADDLQAKLQALKLRAEKSVKNRTLAPRQPPMTRNRRRGYC